MATALENNCRHLDDNNRFITGLEDALLLPSNDTPLETLSGATRVENAGPMEFLRLLSGASAVLTDSFHGSALSIVFGRQFFKIAALSLAPFGKRVVRSRYL